MTLHLPQYWVYAVTEAVEHRVPGGVRGFYELGGRCVSSGLGTVSLGFRAEHEVDAVLATLERLHLRRGRDFTVKHAVGGMVPPNEEITFVSDDGGLYSPVASTPGTSAIRPEEESVHRLVLRATAKQATIDTAIAAARICGVPEHRVQWALDQDDPVPQLAELMRRNAP